MFFPPLPFLSLSSHRLLLPLLLLLPPAHSFIPYLNRTFCCETALIASATDHAHFPFNFHLWNSLVDANSTPPRLPGNDDWNALLDKRNIGPPTNEYSDFRCGTVYSCSDGFETPAAMSIQVSLVWARQTPSCMGVEFVPLAAIDQWAGPLVGFLLPAVVFGLSIPRGWVLSLDKVLQAASILRVDCPRRMRPLLALLRILLGPVVMLLAFINVALVEFLRWAIVILTCAGPILSSALHEMQLDHHLLTQLSLAPSIHTSPAVTELRHRRLLLAILLGNVIDLEGELADSASTTVLYASAAEARCNGAESRGVRSQL